MFAFGSRDVDMRLPGFDLVVSAATSRSAARSAGATDLSSVRSAPS